MDSFSTLDLSSLLPNSDDDVPILPPEPRCQGDIMQELVDSDIKAGYSTYCVVA